MRKTKVVDIRDYRGRRTAPMPATQFEDQRQRLDERHKRNAALADQILCRLYRSSKTLLEVLDEIDEQHANSIGGLQ